MDEINVELTPEQCAEVRRERDLRATVEMIGPREPAVILVGVPFVVTDWLKPVTFYVEPLRAVGPVQSGTLREVKPRGES